MLVNLIVEPVSPRRSTISPTRFKRAKTGRLIVNLVSLNWPGGIFSSRFQYVYRDGPKGEQIPLGPRAYLCVLDGFYREPVKRRTTISSLHTAPQISNTHCFSIYSAGGRAARGEGFMAVFSWQREVKTRAKVSRHLCEILRLIRVECSCHMCSACGLWV
jgi:hypothetical protein